MKTRTMLTGAMVALAMGGATAAVQADPSNAATKAEARAIASADKIAKQAGAALTKGRAVAAIALAEQAVKLRPQDADYRALLGRAYLAAGRFGSARQALADALTLDAGIAGAPLSLALAETASGDPAAARATLAANAGRIGAADRGLALALAGDTAAGIEVLTAAARAPGADAKTRQNLALAYALAGRWPEARTTALIDLPPAEANQRIISWASFARPTGPADQVAALLGVTPVADTGQPTMLALQSQPTAVAESDTPDDPVDAYMPAAVVDTGQSAAPSAPAFMPTVAATPTVSVPMPAAEPLAAAATSVVRVVFGPRKEVVQPIPAAAPRAIAAKPVAAPKNAAAAKTAVAAKAAAVPVAGQGFVVQLGAYRNAEAAKVAWARVLKSLPALAGRAPSGTKFANKRGSFYRLSVGEFVRPEATDLCVKIKASGGACFVRAAAGDAVASWSKPSVQVASR